MIALASRRAGIAALFSVTALVAAGCSGSGADATNDQGFPETLTLAAIPAENSSDLKASYEPVIERLERETGAKVEFVQASDYAGVVEGLIAGNVDLAFFGPFAYVVAGINGAEMTPLGAVVKNEGTPPGYQSYAIARSDNNSVNSLTDYVGKKVCFVDPSSIGIPLPVGRAHRRGRGGIRIRGRHLRRCHPDLRRRTRRVRPRGQSRGLRRRIRRRHHGRQDHDRQRGAGTG